MCPVSSPPAFSSYQLLTLYRGLICPCTEYASHVRGGSTHTELLNKVESKAIRLIDSPLLTLRCNVASLFICYRYFHVNCSSELANCMPPPSHCLVAHNFLLVLIPILSTSLIQERTSIFTLSSLLLVNSGTLYLNLYFHLPTT